MAQQFPEIEAQTILRQLEKETNAREVLARTGKRRRWTDSLVLFAAVVFQQYAFKGLNAPFISESVLMGMFVAIVYLLVLLERVSKRLEAVIQLLPPNASDNA